MLHRYRDLIEAIRWGDPWAWEVGAEDVARASLPANRDPEPFRPPADTRRLGANSRAPAAKAAA